VEKWNQQGVVYREIIAHELGSGNVRCVPLVQKKGKKGIREIGRDEGGFRNTQRRPVQSGTTAQVGGEKVARAGGFRRGERQERAVDRA